MLSWFQVVVILMENLVKGIIRIPIQLQTVACNTQLSLKLFLQGFYAVGSTMVPALKNQMIGMSNTICDTVFVSLHHATTFVQVAQIKSILNTNGITTCNFSGVNGNYFIVVKHRNSIETWSANPVLIVANTAYDFTTSANKSFGSNQIEVEPNIWAIYSGDIDQNSSIDNSDFSLWEADANNFATGYISSDLNGDGSVDNSDFSTWETNANAFVSVVKP